MLSPSNQDLLDKLASNKNFLVIQDVDGVCIQLVKNPLNRTISSDYIKAANRLKDRFFVLTNGEHDGVRGLNRVVERSISGFTNNLRQYYLPGLAAGGVEYQDIDGLLVQNCVTKKERAFLAKVPNLIYQGLYEIIKDNLPTLSHDQVDIISKKSILDTLFSPTINLNVLIEAVNNDINKVQVFQHECYKIMYSIYQMAETSGLKDTFFLHLAPNLGKDNDLEILKLASNENIGTTDIQLMIQGSIKELGLIVLINRYIENQYGVSPLGHDLNVRNLFQQNVDMISLISSIPKMYMPELVGVGDTVTSVYNETSKSYLRGGSDRGFLTLIQEIGRVTKTDNHILLVDSSHGEVDRPSFSDGKLKGITDPLDPLEITNVFEGGPEEYIEWYIRLSQNYANSTK